MYFLQLSKYKKLRIILTTKYLILITKNGILKFKTKFYNFKIIQNKLYIKFYKTNKYCLFPYQQFYIKIIIKDNSLQLLKLKVCYLVTFYNALYSLIFPQKLQLFVKGVGYKFIIEKSLLKIRVGYSHFITFKIPTYIYATVNKSTTLILYSTNRNKLTQFAACIKAQRKIKQYKGTGIFYFDEYTNLKKKNKNKNKNVK